MSEWSLCGDHVNCFCVGIFHESAPKTMNMISTDDHHELVLVCMSYYYWLDIDFNGLCIQCKKSTGETATSYIWSSNTKEKRFLTMSLSIVMPCYVQIATSLSIVASQWMSLATSLPVVVPQWGIPSNVMSHCDVIISHGT